MTSYYKDELDILLRMCQDKIEESDERFCKHLHDIIPMMKHLVAEYDNKCMHKRRMKDLMVKISKEPAFLEQDDDEENDDMEWNDE